jgi:hypothetical protein
MEAFERKSHSTSNKIKTVNRNSKVSPKLHAKHIPRYFKELKKGHTYLILVDNHVLDYTSEHNVLPDSFFATFYRRVEDKYYFNILDVDDKNKNLIEVKLNDPKNTVMEVYDTLLPNTTTIFNSFLGYNSSLPFEPKNRRYRIHPDPPSPVRSSVGLKQKRNTIVTSNSHKTSNSSDKKPKNSSSAGGKTNTRKRNNKYKSKRIN